MTLALMKNTFCKLFFLSLLLFIQSLSHAYTRDVAITMDDLPFVGEAKNFHLDMIINTAKKEEIPLTGFVIANQIEPNNWEMLEKFKNAGLSIGNHTLSHTNLNTTNTEAYIHEIDKADKILAPVITQPKYFRYPYLAEGKGDKKQRVLQFLADKNYHVAPVTIDSKDFIFNQLLLSVPQNERRAFLNVLKPCYLAFIWQQTIKAEANDKAQGKLGRPQILLIHSNLLNAYVLPDIIALYRENHFNFISLNAALKTDENTQFAMAKKRKAPANEHFVENEMSWD